MKKRKLSKPTPRRLPSLKELDKLMKEDTWRDPGGCWEKGSWRLKRGGFSSKRELGVRSQSGLWTGRVGIRRCRIEAAIEIGS